MRRTSILTIAVAGALLWSVAAAAATGSASATASSTPSSTPTATATATPTSTATVEVMPPPAWPTPTISPSPLSAQIAPSVTPSPSPTPVSLSLCAMINSGTPQCGGMVQAHVGDALTLGIFGTSGTVALTINFVANKNVQPLTVTVSADGTVYSAILSAGCFGVGLATAGYDAPAMEVCAQ